jgi:hypothetical protein
MLGFTGIGVVVCFFIPSVDERMTDAVAATSHERNTMKMLGEV